MQMLGKRTASFLMRNMQNLDPIELLDHDELSFAQVWRQNESEQWDAINSNTTQLKNYEKNTNAQLENFMSKVSLLEEQLGKTQA